MSLTIEIALMKFVAQYGDDFLGALVGLILLIGAHAALSIWSKP